ncbi:hypothetical protein HPB49_000061 [Dermacentor silvarum]|uniref:Uncharacterized protein n=1 Tax=Dermacentor silvarum TaxID=543639 RepID=A0ACB8DHQ8_DERSI|nr:hypothetical protein HPB49_000061 [Dermacentor silvarum]
MRPVRGKPLPPLPKNDIKIILKPRKGQALKKYLKTEIPQAIIRSSGTIIPGSRLNQRKITEEDFILRIREGTNIIIVSAPSLEVADVIHRITCMELQGNQHPFNVYVADPDDSYKGWFTDSQHTPNQQISSNTCESGPKDSNTALLIFSGGTRPKCVYYMGVEMRCTEFRPTVQMCLECMQEGHRSDGGGARDPSVPEQTDCRQAREVNSPVSIVGAVGIEDQKGTGALVRVDGGGGLLSTPIEIQIATSKRSKEQYPLEGPLQLQGFAAVEFTTA